MGTLFSKPIPAECVKKSAIDSNVLEVDLEAAWKASDQNAGWSNEVAIELFIR